MLSLSFGPLRIVPKSYAPAPPGAPSAALWGRKAATRDCITLKFNLKYINFDNLLSLDLGTSEIEESFAGFETVDEKKKPKSKLQKLTLVKFDLWMAKVPQF